MRLADAGAVDVYRNLRRRPGCWSVREGGRVARHVAAVTLRDVRFVVRAGAVARVQRQRVREVCAYARGVPCDAPLYPSAVRVTFDPYNGPHFLTDDGVPVVRASLAHFMGDGSCLAVL